MCQGYDALLLAKKKKNPMCLYERGKESKQLKERNCLSFFYLWIHNNFSKSGLSLQTCYDVKAFQLGRD